MAKRLLRLGPGEHIEPADEIPRIADETLASDEDRVAVREADMTGYFDNALDDDFDDFDEDAS